MSTRGSVSSSVASAGTTTSVHAGIVADMAAHVVEFRSVSSSAALQGVAGVFVHMTRARHLAQSLPSALGLLWCLHRVGTTIGKFSRTFTLMRSSTSSKGTQSGPSFAVSHIAFSSPPNCHSRGQMLARGPDRRFSQRLLPATVSLSDWCLSHARDVELFFCLGVPTTLARPGTVAAAVAGVWPRPPYRL